MSSLQAMHKFIKPPNPLGVSTFSLDECLILFNHATRVIDMFLPRRSRGKRVCGSLRASAVNKKKSHVVAANKKNHVGLQLINI